MLFMYNESTIPFNVVKINDGISKIHTQRTQRASRNKDKGSETKRFDTIISNQINVRELESCVDMTSCKCLCGQKTAVRYQKKDIKPIISLVDKYNEDALFINIQLQGSIILGDVRNNTYIQDFMIARGELFMMLSFRNNMNKVSSYEITLHDKNDMINTVYTFERTSDGIELKTNTYQIDVATETPTFRLKRYRPSKPTHLIFVIKGEDDLLTDVLADHTKHEIVVVESHDELSENVDKYSAEGYSVATLFMDDDQFDGSDFNQYGGEYETIKSKFRFVNVLLNNGKVYKK